MQELTGRVLKKGKFFGGEIRILRSIKLYRYSCPFLIIFSAREEIMPPFVCAEKVLWCVPGSYVGAELSRRRGPTFSCLVFFTESEYRGLSLPRLNTCLFCFAFLCSSFICQCAMFRWQWSVTNCPPSMLLSSPKPLVSWSSSTKMAPILFPPSL